MIISPSWFFKFSSIAGAWITGLKDKFMSNFIEDIKIEVALSTIHEEQFETESMREVVKKLKAEWSNSPETGSQLAESLMTIIKGQGAKVQLQSMVDMEFGDNTPVSNAMFSQLGWITDITLFSNLLNIIAEIVSVGQIDLLGTELRAYLDYSGLSQITGFGYGMMLSNVVSPLVTQEINQQIRPSLVDPDRALNMLYREIISSETYNKNMSKMGYSDDQISDFKDAYMYYPAPTDFIRFAVREVFNETVVDKWGYDAEFPIGMSDYVAKAGMSMDILKWYWRAHWEVPSPSMGFEMLHRGVMNEEDLEELLRIADYAPGYIPKMIEISYSPYTRVDAKRMYQAGVLDADALVRAYMDIGYTEEMAENLLSWVQIDSMGSEKNLTQAVILNAYKIGLIDRGVCISYITGLGYDGNEAELIVGIEDNKREQKEIEDRLRTLRAQYVRGVVGDYKFLQDCASLGLTESQVQKELIKAQEEKDRKIKLPSKADLDGWVKNGVISKEDYRSRMLLLGYQADDIGLYLLEE